MAERRLKGGEEGEKRFVSGTLKRKSIKLMRNEIMGLAFNENARERRMKGEQELSRKRSKRGSLQVKMILSRWRSVAFSPRQEIEIYCVGLIPRILGSCII